MSFTPCSKLNKRTKEPCRARATNYSLAHLSQPLCYHHGGAVGSGGDGAPVKTGLHSKFVPDDWQEDFDHYRNDPNITSLDREIGVARVAAARFRAKCVGEVLSAEVCDILIEHGVKIGKLCETHNKIQVGERVIYSPETWTEMLTKVVAAQNEAIDAVVSDPGLRDRLRQAIAERLEK